MTTRAFQKVYTKIDNITKATITLRATGVGNDELATVGGRLAQVVKIMGDKVTLQVFAGTEGLATNSEVVFHGEPPVLRVSDALAGRFFNAYGEPLEGGEQIEGEAREIGGPTVNPFRRIQPSELIDFVILQQDAFDDIDANCPIERQKMMYNMVLDICRNSYDLADFEECSKFFKELIYLFRQMNYSEWKSAQFDDFRTKIEALVNEKLVK